MVSVQSRLKQLVQGTVLKSLSSKVLLQYVSQIQAKNAKHFIGRNATLGIHIRKSQLHDVISLAYCDASIFV